MFLRNVERPENVDEATLIDAAASDPAAWESLYRLYVRRLYQYVRAHVGSDEDAADMTQQVFLQAFVALRQSRPQHFAAWLFKIAYNVIVNASQRRRTAISVERLPESLHPVASGDPESLVLQREATTALTALLAQLSPDNRELVALRFAASLSSEEIALVVGKKPEAVKKQLSRILHRLKEHYHEA